MFQTYPLLPLRDIVVFPQMIVPLFVGRDKSVAALERAMEQDKEIFLVAQLDPARDDPDRDDLYDIGVVATVLQLLKLPDGTVRVLVEGGERARLNRLETSGDHVLAEVETIPARAVSGTDVNALMRSVVEQFENYAKLNKKLPAETAVQLAEIDDASKLADAVAANISVKVADKQSLLTEDDPVKRLEMVFGFMEGELGVLQVEKKIRGRVKRQMEKTQREYYLNEQLKAIQSELGNGDGDDGNGVNEFAEKIEKLKLSPEAKAKATAELKKLRGMAPMSAEATVVRNYLDVLLGLPWGKKSKLKKNIAEAQTILDDDHFGLEKVKDRIIEYLAVQARTNKLKGPILCLVGPPGVGKTSLGRSIAKATGREFVRQSLGGVRDEAEIRGHRRTYIGSLPGKIVNNLKKAGTSNPLFLLDEIDKLGADWRGDILLGVCGDGDVVLVVAAVGDVVVDEEIGQPFAVEAEPGPHFGAVGLGVIAVQVQALRVDAEAHLIRAILIDPVEGRDLLVPVGVEDGNGKHDQMVEPGGETAGKQDVAQQHDGRVLASVLPGMDAILKQDDCLSRAPRGRGREGAVLGNHQHMKRASRGGIADELESRMGRGLLQFAIEAQALLVAPGAAEIGAFRLGKEAFGRAGGTFGERRRFAHGGGLGHGLRRREERQREQQAKWTQPKTPRAPVPDFQWPNYCWWSPIPKRPNDRATLSSAGTEVLAAVAHPSG